MWQDASLLAASLVCPKAAEAAVPAGAEEIGSKARQVAEAGVLLRFHAISMGFRCFFRVFHGLLHDFSRPFC